jgi:hypothetical protein
MTKLGAKHVQQPSLEPDLDTEHVWCLFLTQVKDEEPDMSGPCTRYVRDLPLEPSYSAG